MLVDFQVVEKELFELEKTTRRPIPIGQTPDNFLYGREAWEHFKKYKVWVLLLIPEGHTA